MVKQTRSNDWGFPRWRAYDRSRDAAQIRLCDRDGCTAPGDRPAPKSPNSPERWQFCETHAAEYNKGWNYFEGLDKESAEERMRGEQADASAYSQASHWGWAGSGDGSRSREEMRALDALGVEVDAPFADIKAAHRRLAKANHPDLKQGDKAAAAMFQKVQAAYEVLRKSEERRVEAGVKG